MKNESLPFFIDFDICIQHRSLQFLYAFSIVIILKTWKRYYFSFYRGFRNEIMHYI